MRRRHTLPAPVHPCAADTGPVPDERTNSTPTGSEPTADVSPCDPDLAVWRTQLVEYRAHLWTLRQTALVQTDSLILAFSGALLTLSVSFVKDLVPLPRAVCRCALVGSWVCLALTVVAVLASQLCGRVAIDKRLRAVGNAIADPTAVDEGDDPTLAKWTEGLNYAAAGLLIIGVGLTISFASANILKEGLAMPKTTHRTAPVKEGITPPPAPKKPSGALPGKPVPAPPSKPSPAAPSASNQKP